MTEARPYAHVVGDTIANVSLWDGVTEYTPPEEGAVMVPLSDDFIVGKGWKLIDGVWQDPNPPVQE